MSNLERSVLIPDGVAPPGGKYTHAIRDRGGELLFISGQVAIDAAGDFVGKDDVVTQPRQVFENLGNVLKSRGRYAEAIEHYRRALGVDPEKADPVSCGPATSYSKMEAEKK